MIDELGNVRCDTCKEILEVGDYPFCPHGRGSSAINRDEIPGGVVLENYGPKPVRFDSHSERRRYMAENGLREKEKFCPLPGTDKDPAGIPNPKGYMDPQTLENARVLISRNGKGKEPDPNRTEGVLVDLFSSSITSRDAIALQNGDNRRLSRIHRRTRGAH